MSSGDPLDSDHEPIELPADHHEMHHLLGGDGHGSGSHDFQFHGLNSEEPSIIGTPHHDAQYWRHQKEDFTCGIVTQAEILACLTGVNYSETYAAVEAANAHLLTTAGTAPQHMGRWLEGHGMACHEEANGSFLDIIQELRDGNKVMVDVDSAALWHSHDALAALGSQAKDHAIWLTGVDVSDPHHIKMIINDSGKPDGAGNVYDLHDLEQVLHALCFHYVATGDSSKFHMPDHPSGYDPDHGVFSALDDFLHDHGVGTATMTVAVTALGAAAALRSAAALHQKTQPPAAGNPPPFVPARVPSGLLRNRQASYGKTLDREIVEGEWTEIPKGLEAPPSQRALPAPALVPVPRIENMSRAERDALLRKL